MNAPWNRPRRPRPELLSYSARRSIRLFFIVMGLIAIGVVLGRLG